VVGVAAAMGRRERNEERIILFRVVQLYCGLISEKDEGFFINYTLPHVSMQGSH